MTDANSQKRIEKPIFVFGCNNSGTTILGKALQSHKEIDCPPDEGPLRPGWPKEMTHFLCSHTFRIWAHPIWRKGNETLPGDNLAYYMSEEDVSDSLSRKITDFYGSYNQRICDHSPQFTLRARALQEIFPDAYFVAIVRNGYAVAEGTRRKREFDPDRPHMSGFPTTIEDAATHWCNANRIIESYQRLGLLKRVTIITYENLVQKTDETLQGVLGFCGLNPQGFSIPQFEKGLNDTQISRLDQSEIAAITRIANPMLAHFKYPIPKEGYQGVY